MSDWERVLLEGARQLGLDLEPSDLPRFRINMSQLLLYNDRLNLTAITDSKGIAILHFLDSLTCLLAVPPGGPLRVADVGSGGGFPGIPLAIAVPQWQVTLIESSARKAGFLQRLARMLGLPNLTVLCQRAEEAGRGPQRESFGLVVSRALAALPVLAEYCLPLVEPGGLMLAQKGPEAGPELSEALAAIELLGGSPERMVELELPEGAGRRSLVVIRKVSLTPARYPRRQGIPAKRPLDGRRRPS